ncbi:DNA-binding protein [Thiomicrolovo sp. ZZH C-3]
MSKMTVAEAAEHFKVSKEAIHNRIRRGTLNSVIENGVKYVLLADAKPAVAADSRFHDYIEKENERLKTKNEQLEAEVNRLRDQREAMLIAEREKVEQIYKERDEQLKNVLQVFASKLLPEQAAAAVVDEAVSAEIVESAPEALSEEEFEDGIIEESSDEGVAEEAATDSADPFADDDFDDLVSLKDFMKLKGYGKKHRKRVKERFESRADEDSRILTRGGKLHLRPYHYDYSDLLK